MAAASVDNKCWVIINFQLMLLRPHYCANQSVVIAGYNHNQSEGSL